MTGTCHTMFAYSSRMRSSILSINVNACDSKNEFPVAH